MRDWIKVGSSLWVCQVRPVLRTCQVGIDLRLCQVRLDSRLCQVRLESRLDLTIYLGCVMLGLTPCLDGVVSLMGLMLDRGKDVTYVDFKCIGKVSLGPGKVDSRVGLS